MKKHTLLATTGASPQVVTETLHAIHHENLQWPDDIYLITTSFGKKAAVKGLLEEGHLQRLCIELNRPMPAFSGNHVLVTPGADGTEVEDARSLPDHEALANFIMTEVRNRTASPDTSLHASLAGGRKTMTFYIGYAMSLFGRAQDTLSHVLVSEGYENIPDFWFPTQSEAHRYVDNRGRKLDASTAEVTLAPIPFIRHRRNLPQVLLQSDSTVQFADLVQLINLGENRQDIRVSVDLPAQTLRVHNENNTLNVEITLGLLELAFYTFMARATLKGETDWTRPSKDKRDAFFAKVLLEDLLPLCGLACSDDPLDNVNRLSNYNTMHTRFKSDTIEALRCGIAQNWFDSRKNKITRALTEKLPENLVRWIAPASIWTEDGTRLSDDEIEKTLKGGGYGLPLEKHQISIVEIQ
ncbi:MAG: TIGR02584 family CRISPR-associated protein [Xylophilus sp.]|nr:TIGR02584 family CRISPR-associated protein [Xylophilus sp.]